MVDVRSELENLRNTPPEEEPLRQDGTWVLPDDTFGRWWDSVSPIIRAEFDLKGGNDTYARFACAIVMLSSQHHKLDGKLVILAWSMAARIPLDANAIYAHAERALELDCVRTLLERLWRERRNFRNHQLANRSAQLVENMVEGAMDADTADQAKAVAAVASFMRYETLENERVLDEQRRLGADEAAKQIGVSGQTLDEYSDEQLASFEKAIKLARSRKNQKAIGA